MVLRKNVILAQQTTRNVYIFKSFKLLCILMGNSPFLRLLKPFVIQTEVKTGGLFFLQNKLTC